MQLSTVHAEKKRLGQSGVTYLAISVCARESGMGDAGTATVQGINGMWHNPSVLADVEGLKISLNHVHWLVDTRLSGAALAYTIKNWGTFALDLTYMDYGEVMGTKAVDRSIDPRGYILTGDLGIKDYAIGFAYSRRINEKFSFGLKIKRIHENLGTASYVTDEYQDPESGEWIRTRDEKEWKLNDWGLDFGTVYNVGWKGLTVAMVMQNLSRDLKYFYEEFQLPLTLKMGIAMDMAQLFLPTEKDIRMLIAVDAIRPIDYSERIHIGSEFILKNIFALRAGYKFNHDVESLTLGIGVNFELAGIPFTIDYAYTKADYFKDVNRFSFNVNFPGL
jgi:hypothetical protein